MTWTESKRTRNLVTQTQVLIVRYRRSERIATVVVEGVSVFEEG